MRNKRINMTINLSWQEIKNKFVCSNHRDDDLKLSCHWLAAVLMKYHQIHNFHNSYDLKSDEVFSSKKKSDEVFNRFSRSWLQQCVVVNFTKTKHNNPGLSPKSGLLGHQLFIHNFCPLTNAITICFFWFMLILLKLSKKIIT